MTTHPFTLTPAEQHRVEHIDQLTVRGGDGVAELVDAMSDSSWTVRRAAVAALVALGDEAIPALAAWLTEQRTSEHAIAAAVDAFAASVGTTATAAAVKLLAHSIPAVAADGASILGRRHALDAVELLAAQLEHPDDNVAVASIEALGVIVPSGLPAHAIDPLIRLLEKRSFFRAFATLQVLARAADPRTVQPIAALLSDPVFGAEAIRALGRTGLAAAIAPLSKLLPVQTSTVVTALAELVARAEWSGAGPHVSQILNATLAPQLATLIAALPSASATERAAIITLLGRAGSPTVVPVLAALLDDPGARLLAIDAIKALTRSHEVALLATLETSDTATLTAVLPLVTSVGDSERARELLDDSDPEVRARACEALARLGDTTAVPALFAALADRNPRVALAATGAIQSLQTADTGARTLAALADGAPAVRRQALRIIAYLGFPATFEPLLAATADPDRRVAELAITALAASSDPRVDDALGELARSPDATLRATTMRAWSTRDPHHAAPHLEHGLGDPDAWVRYYACQGLGRIGHTAATPSLLARLADAMPHVRIAAIEALARFDTPAAWEALTAAVRSRDPDECRAALVGLGQRARPAAVPILVEAAHSADLPTKLIAISGLARQTAPDAIAELAVAARSTDPALRDAALSLLSERDDRAAVLALIAIAVEAPLTDRAHLALSTPSATRSRVIGEALQAADDHAAPVLAAALARMSATSQLFAALSSGTSAARRAAASVLFAIDAVGAREAVAKLALVDPDPDVRRFCVALA